MRQPTREQQDVESLHSPASPLPESDLQKLAFFSLLGGITSFIPVPFLDDWVFRFVRQEAIESVFSSGTRQVDRARLRSLSRSGRSGRSCLGTLSMLVLLPVRIVVYGILRLFKKILIFLVLKEATDRASLIFHEGYLFEYAARSADFNFQEEGWVQPLRECVAAVISSTDTSPFRGAVKRVFRESAGLVSSAARRAVRLLRWAFLSKRRDSPRSAETIRRHKQSFLEDEGRVLSAPADRLLELLTGDERYLRELEISFQRLARERGLISES